MEITVFAAVLFASFLHALWNFLVKDKEDKAKAMLAVACGHTPFAAISIAVAGPPPADVALLVIASAIVHTGYLVFLMNAYRFGALSVIYPFARGTSPLVIVLWTFASGSDALTATQLAGIAVVAIALMCFGVFQLRSSHVRGDGGKGVALAFITGVFIAGYTILDSLGTRASGNPLSFFGAVALLNAVLMMVCFFFIYPQKLKQVITMQETKRSFWLGGGTSYLAYSIVLWAVTHAPVAVVSSVRETSVLFAILLGAVFLQEKITRLKILAGIMVLAGLVLLRLG